MILRGEELILYNINLTFIKGDVRNKKLMKYLISRNEFIIPLAALVGAPICEKNKNTFICGLGDNIYDHGVTSVNDIKFQTHYIHKKL